MRTYAFVYAIEILPHFVRLDDMNTMTQTIRKYSLNTEY